MAGNDLGKAKSEDYCNVVLSLLVTSKIEETGIIEAYDCICYCKHKDILRSLCKYGLPREGIFEFAAQSMIKFDKKWKAKKLKELQEKIKQREKEREKKKEEEKKKREIEEEQRRIKGKQIAVA